MRILMVCAIFMVTLTVLHADIRTREVTYEADGVQLRGFIAFDDAPAGKRPGILIVHEWWGQNQYARDRAKMLASLGYVAMAVDMYGDGKTADHPEDAMRFSSAVSGNMPVMQGRFNAALAVLSADPRVDPDRIGAIGYCFGGGVVLNMARSGAPLKVVVSFHGSLGTSHPAHKGDVKAKLLVCNGADDTFVSADAIAAFRKEMDDAGVDYRFVQYEGAIHSFTNPASTELGKKFGLAMAYNEKADKESWAVMKEFFSSALSR